MDIIRTGGRTGTAKEHTEQTKKVKDNSNVINKDSNNEDGNRLDQGKQETGTAAKLPANFDRICRYNTRRLLHYRNIYTFLAAVNDDIIQNHESPLYDIAAYVLARKILDMIVWLQQIIICEICPLKGLTHWELYRKEQQFAEVKTYVDNEY